MRKLILPVALLGFISVPALAEEPQTHIVEIRFDENTGDMFYDPARLEISAGDTVTWVNTDPYSAHDVMFDANGIPKDTAPAASPMLEEEGESWSYSFTVPGTYRYHCHPHHDLDMRGEIIVDRESLPHEFRQADDPHHGHGGQERHDHH